MSSLSRYAHKLLRSHVSRATQAACQLNGLSAAVVSSTHQSSLIDAARRSAQYCSSAQGSKSSTFWETGKTWLNCGLLGTTAVVTASAFDDLYIYYTCQSEALKVINSHARLGERLGENITPRPWWDGTLNKSNDGAFVSVSFVVEGSKASSEVFVRAGQFSGHSFTLLYDTIGEGKWKVLFLDAMLPDKLTSRLPQRIDLLAVQPDEAQQKTNAIAKDEAGAKTTAA